LGAREQHGRPKEQFSYSRRNPSPKLKILAQKAQIENPSPNLTNWKRITKDVSKAYNKNAIIVIYETLFYVYI
jgi:hypothetical protein